MLLCPPRASNLYPSFVINITRNVNVCRIYVQYLFDRQDQAALSSIEQRIQRIFISQLQCFVAFARSNCCINVNNKVLKHAFEVDFNM